MAMGDERGSNRGSNNKLFESTYYSRLGFKNPEEKLRLGFQFKSGMLIVDISKEKDGFQFESLINCYITYAKAKILLERIKEFEEDIKNGNINPENGYGINTGMGETVKILALRLNPDNSKGITIAKVNNNGNIIESVDYNFNKEYHYGLKWNNISSMNVEKVYYDDIEYELLKDALTQFVNTSSGAIGYSVADITRYDLRSILNKMNPIYDKLGIEVSRGNNYGKSNDFMANAPARQSNHRNFEDIDDEFSGLEDE